MILDKKDLILDFVTKEITKEEFEEQYPQVLNKEYLDKQFKAALKNKDALTIDYLFKIRVYISNDFFYLICKQLITEDWHRQHENIALMFQFNYKNPDCIDIVVQSMYLQCEHWDEDAHRDPFIRKCAYILGDLKTPYAIAKLKELSLSDDEMIKGYCTYQLKRIGEIT
ncbi:hypothetical protein EI427_23780 [Flammeovirga pectinis]|uniref:HEAT repeat domain-containing protein n=1 Tax=Flammeovirga pectinis TaxID=2494373 RepID=A0A3Q9FUA0_9BACT|nr:hypothetical protein [Flammeovirga pectinis]AZQ65237.1 hypothetical protein EI427_23780 [Flammeovirga pectinis]